MLLVTFSKVNMSTEVQPLPMPGALEPSTYRGLEVLSMAVLPGLVFFLYGAGLNRSQIHGQNRGQNRGQTQEKWPKKAQRQLTRAPPDVAGKQDRERDAPLPVRVKGRLRARDRGRREAAEHASARGVAAVLGAAGCAVSERECGSTAKNMKKNMKKSLSLHLHEHRVHVGGTRAHPLLLHSRHRG